MANSSKLNFRRRQAGQRSLGAIEIWTRLHRRHLAWSAVAVLASLLIHLLLILFFPSIDIYKIGSAPAPEKQTTVRLEDVKTVTEVPDTDRRPPKFKPEAARGAIAGEIGAEVTTIQRPANEAATEPREVGAGVLIGEQRNLAEPVSPDRPLWEPRQEILSITKIIAKDTDAMPKPRRYIQAVPRSASGPDIVAPANREDIASGLTGTGAYYLTDDPSKFSWGRRVTPSAGPGGKPREVPPPKTVLQEEPKKLVEPEKDQRREILRALDKYLRADVYAYRSPADPFYDYCRIEIKRRSADLLPVLPKDLLLVQDGSASITEQKLRFCREGMTRALGTLGPGDRFNVVEFRDSVVRCFDDWVSVSPDTVRKAKEFIGRMESVGNTDIFDSLKDLTAGARKPGRPVIVMMVSDGVATTGLTDHSLIIEAFSQVNRGAVSVFTVGTYPGVNAYLLDLLSYRNRGDTFVVRTGRWDIPEVIENRVREVGRPVLSDVRFRFAGGTFCDAYPLLTSNLYLDRPLVLYGRYPRDAKQLVFRATGRADEIECDMVFDLDLKKVLSGEKEIRTEWARQRAYFLIGEHNRTKQPGILTELRQLEKVYGVRIPYYNEITK